MIPYVGKYTIHGASGHALPKKNTPFVEAFNNATSHWWNTVTENHSAKGWQGYVCPGPATMTDGSNPTHTNADDLGMVNDIG